MSFPVLESIATPELRVAFAEMRAHVLAKRYWRWATTPADELLSTCYLAVDRAWLRKGDSIGAAKAQTKWAVLEQIWDDRNRWGGLDHSTANYLRAKGSLPEAIELEANDGPAFYTLGTLGAPDPDLSWLPPLSPVEREVVRLSLMGADRHGVAEALRVPLSTATVYRRNAMDKIIRAYSDGPRRFPRDTSGTGRGAWSLEGVRKCHAKRDQVLAEKRAAGWISRDERQAKAKADKQKLRDEAAAAVASLSP